MVMLGFAPRPQLLKPIFIRIDLRRGLKAALFQDKVARPAKSE